MPSPNIPTEHFPSKFPTHAMGILNAEKRISGVAEWENLDATYKATIEVDAPTLNENLTLKVILSKLEDKYVFTLVTNNGTNLLCFESEGQHGNHLYNTHVFNGKHKHIITKLGESSHIKPWHFAYLPEEMLADRSRWQDDFSFFLQECNIDVVDGFCFDSIPASPSQEHMYTEEPHE